MLNTAITRRFSFVFMVAPSLCADSSEAYRRKLLSVMAGGIDAPIYIKPLV